MTTSVTGRRILFVDDDAAILDGLRSVFRGERKRWDMRFGCSGADALELLAAEPVDVVVADMRMPTMDGLELLRHIKQRWPRTARVILSGYSDVSAVARASAIAHRFLPKPCDPDALRAVVERLCGLQDLLHSDALQQVLGAVGSLPTASRFYDQLSTVLEAPGADNHQLAVIVQQDAGLSARILQFVNSATLPEEAVTSIEQAVVRLGPGTLRLLSLSLEIMEAFTLSGPAIRRATLLQQHLQLTAVIARRLVDSLTADAAFAGGLLHDAGAFVLMSRLPEQYEEALQRAEATHRPLQLVEREVIGASHAEIGAYLLGLWGLPPAIVEAVALHHEPHPTIEGSLDTSSAVAIADLLAHLVGGDPLEPGVPRSEALLQQLNVDRAADWQRLAEQEAARLGVVRSRGEP